MKERQIPKPRPVEKEDPPKVAIKEEPVRFGMKKTVFSLKKKTDKKKKIVPRKLGLFRDDSDDEGGLGVKADELVKEEPTISKVASPTRVQQPPAVLPPERISEMASPAPPTSAPLAQKSVSPPAATVLAPTTKAPVPAPAPAPASTGTEAQPAADAEAYKKQLEEYYKQQYAGYTAAAATNQYAAYPHGARGAASKASAEEQLKAYAASGIPIGLQYPVNQVTVDVGQDLKSFGLIPRLQSTGGPCTYTVHPTLPAGVKVDANNGELYGAPTEVSGTIAVNVYATNAWGTAVTSIMFTVVDNEENDGEGAYDLDLGIGKSKKVYRTKSEAIADFEKMLEDLNCRVSETWHEAQIRLKKDERFYALHMMAERRRVWQRYIKHLDSAAPTQPAMAPAEIRREQNPLYQTQTYPPQNPQDAFKQLLQEKLSARKEIFDENPVQFIVNDSRYNAIDPDKRKDLIAKHLEKQRKLLKVQAQYDMATKRHELVALLRELSLDTPTPLFHMRTPWTAIIKLPKFSKDRRFVQFSDGSNDLSLTDAKDAYTEFCQELFEKMTKDRVQIKQYFRDLNFNVSGRTKLSDLVRKHKKAVELKTVNKRYMRLIFKQMIDRAKLREERDSRSHSRGRDYKRKKKRKYNDRREYRSKRNEHNQMSSGKSRKESEDKFKIDDTKLKEWDNFDLDENAFPETDNNTDKKRHMQATDSNTQEQGMAMSDSDEEAPAVVKAEVYTRPAPKPKEKSGVRLAFTLTKKKVAKKPVLPKTINMLMQGSKNMKREKTRERSSKRKRSSSGRPSPKRWRRRSPSPKRRGGRSYSDSRSPAPRRRYKPSRSFSRSPRRDRASPHFSITSASPRKQSPSPRKRSPSLKKRSLSSSRRRVSGSPRRKSQSRSPARRKSPSRSVSRRRRSPSPRRRGRRRSPSPRFSVSPRKASPSMERRKFSRSNSKDSHSGGSRSPKGRARRRSPSPLSSRSMSSGSSRDGRKNDDRWRP